MVLKEAVTMYARGNPAIMYGTMADRIKCGCCSNALTYLEMFTFFERFSQLEVHFQWHIYFG